MRNQKGFTLIELIMVIVILGILAATAIPRFIDLETRAGLAAAEGVAGALAAGSAINFASCKAGASPCIDPVSACGDLSVTVEGGIPAGFTLGGTLPNCTITHDDTSQVATVTVVTP